MIIGYTTGVFDLFHIGHLNILRRAKEQCDYLIVGVSTDELVEQYKNKRPIISFEERCEIVKAIRYVDEVVPQMDREKFAAWERLKFNKMFVGDDWKGSPKWESIEKELNSIGLPLMYLPHTDGISSSRLRDTIIKNEESEIRQIFSTQSNQL